MADGTKGALALVVVAFAFIVLAVSSNVPPTYSYFFGSGVFLVLLLAYKVYQQ